MKTLILFALPLFAAINSSPIPRTALKDFKLEGVFEGGAPIRANLENVRVAPHAKEGYERWVIDFSDLKTRTLDSAAPRFQVRYIKGEKVANTVGREVVISEPKFIITLRSIERNYLNPQRLEKITQKSRFVKEVKLHPQIEDGDLALEFVLRDTVQFEPHQPIEKEGRLVLDLKNAPLGKD